MEGPSFPAESGLNDVHRNLSFIRAGLWAVCPGVWPDSYWSLFQRLLAYDVAAGRPSLSPIRHPRAPNLTKPESRQRNRRRRLSAGSSSGDCDGSNDGRGGAGPGTPRCRRTSGPGPWRRHPGQERRGTLERDGGRDGPVRPATGRHESCHSQGRRAPGGSRLR